MVKLSVALHTLSAGSLLIAATAFAQAPASELQTEFVFEIEAEISAAVVMGETVDGRRQSIPITGGRFSGDGIRGEVLPGGADYQVVRADGVVAIEAIYMIRTDDGALINVVNKGLINSNVEGGPAARYFRTVPEFVAPIGPYDWLNKHIFISSISTRPEQPGRVFIRVYKVL